MVSTKFLKWNLTVFDMVDMLNIKIDIEEVDEVAWVDRTKLNYFCTLYLYYYYITIIIIYYYYLLLF